MRVEDWPGLTDEGEEVIVTCGAWVDATVAEVVDGMPTVETALEAPAFRVLILVKVRGPTLPYPVVWGVPEVTMPCFAWKLCTAA